MIYPLHVKSGDPSFELLIFLYDPNETHKLKLDTMKYYSMIDVSL